MKIRMTRAMVDLNGNACGWFDAEGVEG